MIVGMAGHVDHGKTALVQALTGAEGDRLAEERRRGMTIDLGFAYARLPDGGLIGFIDVPGHERFLGTTLAGVLGVQTGLLVVAADDGPMPQTIEHLEVLRLIRLPRLLVALTKADRVGPGGLRAAEEATAALLQRLGFAGAPIFPVSSVTGQGIAELRRALGSLAAARAHPPRPQGFRMAVDRAFHRHGTGLVVTGTIAAGEVRPGQSVLASPSGLVARVRAIQIAGNEAEKACAGERCALALSGPKLERSHLGRGEWVIAPHLHAPTRRLDAVLRATGPLRHTASVLAHIGAAAMPARVLLPGGADLAPGDEGPALLTLDAPVAALHDDPVVLRAAATARLVAGGRVIDPFPPEVRESPDRRLRRLRAQAAPSPALAMRELLEAQGSVDLNRFALARNRSPAEAVAWAAAAGAVVRSGAALSAAAHQELRDRLTEALRAWHAREPGRIGPTQAALLSRLRAAHSRPVLSAVLDEMLAETAVVREGAALRLPSHRPRLEPADEAFWTRLQPMLRQAGLRPPRLRELAETFAMPLDQVECAVLKLEHFGLLVRVAANRVFLPDTVTELAAIAAALAEEAPDGFFTAAAFNTRAQIGRNLTIQVLEHLDTAGLTRRVGESRMMVR